MSVIKYGVFRLLRITGRIIVLIGVICVLAAMTSQEEGAMPIAVGILLLGIILNWVGGFRAKATIIERGTKDALKGMKDQK